MPFDISQFQPRAWEVMARSVESDRVAGTYLLCGPDGCGRWGLAVSFAALLNCEARTRTAGGALRPCGGCRNCRLIFALNFEGLAVAAPLPPHKGEDEAVELTNEVIDLKRREPFAVLSATANLTIPIDTARRIKRTMATKPPPGVYRTIIFYQMERMRPEAADALLKMIEEPPSQAVILLIAEKAERLLPTIQSRSRKVTLRSSPPEVVAEYLRAQYGLAEARAELAARTAEGIAGRAVQAAESGDDEASGRVTAFQLFRSLFEDSGPETVARLTAALGERDRGEAEYLLHLWQSLARDCMQLAVAGAGGAVVNTDFRAELERLAEHFADPATAVRLAEEIKIALAHFRLNVHIHGALAALALRTKAAASRH
ncbi:MAG TPA: hypothetical protein PK186_08915 [candidate division Zixibacteria bacterium]|nr:hypothetical protein [candidate division Zixibacteria bacterium]MDD4916356.1 hypothetical protein [candidate division Zixibacteria bacterium]MDM7972816.1 hypothetical protein [candidate division Zixibacteria bacterium]HOD66591.1 hypothetical protein [candidate division Zixibacteria bacterium]HPC11043.1 hypothetical protein [candidate division Zixibacteria bacterium]